MKIFFRDKSLEKITSDYKSCIRKFGIRRAKLLIKRINTLYEVETLEDARFLPGNYHELKNIRKGQWACDLDHPYRLLFIPNIDPIPKDFSGKFNWKLIRSIVITEIVDYH